MDFTKIIEWLKANKWLAIGAGALVIFLFFPKLLKFGSVRRRRRDVTTRVSSYRRKKNRTIPRSVGIKKQYSANGKVKKPWQIKGSLAAKRHMAQIRKLK
jgi:hypothetical protein